MYNYRSAWLGLIYRCPILVRGCLPTSLVRVLSGCTSFRLSLLFVSSSVLGSFSPFLFVSSISSLILSPLCHSLSYSISDCFTPSLTHCVSLPGASPASVSSSHFSYSHQYFLPSVSSPNCLFPRLSFLTSPHLTAPPSSTLLPRFPLPSLSPPFLR